MKKTKLLVIFLLTFILVTACANKGETPEQAVKNALEAFSKLDLKALAEYLPSEELANLNYETEEDREFTLLLMKNLKCKVLEVDKDGDRAVVKTEISNTDLAAAFLAYFEKIFEMTVIQSFSADSSGFDEDEIDQLLLDILGQDSYGTHTSVIDINLQRIKGNWILEVENDEDFQNAIWGGAVKALGADLNNL